MNLDYAKIFRSARYVAVILLSILIIIHLLPVQLGGDKYYFYVVTWSMGISMPQGSFVVAQAGGPYMLGDIVVYRADSILVGHRLVGFTEDGSYLIKGDVVEWPEKVEPERVMGYVIFAVAFYGYIFMYAKSFHISILLALLYISMRKMKKSSELQFFPLAAFGIFVLFFFSPLKNEQKISLILYQFSTIFLARFIESKHKNIAEALYMLVFMVGIINSFIKG